jgi:DNA-binding response OmpR family regulator
MQLAIIGGNFEDERHLGRLADKAALSVSFVRPAAASLIGDGPPAPPSVLEHVITRVDRERLDEPEIGQMRSVPLRALIVDAGERAEGAVRLLAAVRRDPYFERIGTLLILQAEQAGSLTLPGGFDDFVLYPCSVEELTIRVLALGHRRSSFGSRSSLDESGVVVDETSRDVIVDGRAVQLTAREFALFTYLCEWRGKVLSREHLLARVWGSRYSGGRRTVDIHVRRLRAKLGESLAIETLRGSGYRLRREPAGASSMVLEEPFPTELGPAYSGQTAQAFAAQIPEPFSKVS